MHLSLVIESASSRRSLASLHKVLCCPICSIGRSPPVHEFHGHFEGQPARIRVTSVTGHVFSTDFPGQYSNWEAVDPVDLFKAPTRKEPTSKFITHHLASEGKGADALVLWLDCDREGENICFEVIECMQAGFKAHTRILRSVFPPPHHCKTTTEESLYRAHSIYVCLSTTCEEPDEAGHAC